MVVDVRLKFDEALHLQPAVTPQTVQQAVERPPAAGGLPAGAPLLTRRGEQNVSYIFGRIPKSASVELPGYRQAGQFSCEFDFRDLPIDPRTVRAASVEIHLGAVADADFAAGMVETPAGRSRRSVLRTRDGDGPNLSTLRLVGLVDEWGVNHDETGSVVSFRGRDLRGVLLDTPIGVLPGAQAQLLENLDWGQDIRGVVRQILDFGSPLFQEIAVQVNEAEWPDGVLPSPGNPGVVPRNRRGARGQRAGGRGTPNADSGNLNFWDLIVRACYLVGAIPYFRGRDLRLRPTRSIFQQQFDTTIPAPFANGQERSIDAQTQTAISPPLRVRRLAYGRDIKQMSFDRKYGGYQRPRVIRCVSVDTSSTERGANRLVEGRWPAASAPEGARRTRVAPGGQAAQEEILNVPVAGIRDTQRLADIARGIYEEIGRGEMGGTISTKNLASFGGDNSDPDLLRLDPGDGLELFVDARAVTSAPPLVSTLTDFTRVSFEEAVQDLVARLGDENLARVIVATSRGMIQEVQRFFRVSTVKYAWDGQGIRIDTDFQNYVVARDDLTSPADTGEQPPPWESGQLPPDDAVQTVTSHGESDVSADAPISILSGGET